jgi:hypothetical protein
MVLLVERFQCRQDRQERGPGDGLDDQPRPFFPEGSLAAGQLEISRDPKGLIPAVPEQAYVTFLGDRLRGV